MIADSFRFVGCLLCVLLAFLLDMAGEGTVRLGLAMISGGRKLHAPADRLYGVVLEMGMDLED